MLVLGALLAPWLASPTLAQEATPAGEVFVSPERAWALVQDEDAVLLDARPEATHWLGRPAGAIAIDWQRFSDEAEPGRLYDDAHRLSIALSAYEVDRAHPVVVVGNWDEGWGEEGRIFWMLDYLGHPSVHIVEGGFAAWRAAGLPVSRGPSPRTNGVTPPFDLRPDPARLATLEEVAAGRVALLDVRAPDEFAGAVHFGEVRGGHVPGAVNVEWTQLLDGPHLITPAAARALLPDPDQRVVVYCTGGVRSGFVYAVLRHLGYADVANYAGSWWEYARSPLPADASQGAP